MGLYILFFGMVKEKKSKKLKGPNYTFTMEDRVGEE
jgi:hypothetical protein